MNKPISNSTHVKKDLFYEIIILETIIRYYYTIMEADFFSNMRNPIHIIESLLFQKIIMLDWVGGDAYMSYTSVTL